MKYDNLQAFVKHLEAAAPDHLSELYLLISKDSYERKEALSELLKVLSCTTTTAKDVDAALDSLNTLSLFGEKRAVILHDAPKSEKLFAYFENPAPNTTLILIAPSLAKNTVVYKKSEKAGIILDIPEAKPWEKERKLQQWVVDLVRKQEKDIEPQAAVLLIQTSGLDQTLLEKEIEKLLSYIGERSKITAQDISAITNTVNTETAWQLGEAIFQRNAKTAFRISKALLDDGTPFLALIRQIRSQIQTEFQICTIMKTTGNRQDITALFPYMRGNLLEKHISNATAYGLLRLRNGLLKIDEIELAAKNGSTSPELLSDILIGHLTR